MRARSRARGTARSPRICAARRRPMSGASGYIASCGPTGSWRRNVTRRGARPVLTTARIIPESPDLLWGTDATRAWTKSDGWVWAFCCIDHFSAEAWTSVAKRGDHFASLGPIYDAVTDRFGKVDKDLARGISLRHDWGPQYTSGHFQGAIRYSNNQDIRIRRGRPHVLAVWGRKTRRRDQLWGDQFAAGGAASTDRQRRPRPSARSGREGRDSPVRSFQRLATCT